MAAQDHMELDGSAICAWCHNYWPCKTAEIVQETLDDVVAVIQKMATMRGGDTLDLDTLDRVQDVVKRELQP